MLTADSLLSMETSTFFLCMKYHHFVINVSLLQPFTVELKMETTNVALFSHVKLPLQAQITPSYAHLNMCTSDLSTIETHACGSLLCLELYQKSRQLFLSIQNKSNSRPYLIFMQFNCLTQGVAS